MLKKLGIFIAISGVIVGWFSWYLGTFMRLSSDGAFSAAQFVEEAAARERLFQNDLLGIRIVVPVDWYLHETLDGDALLLKVDELPEIGAREGWAYGEQIMVRSAKLGGESFGDWVADQVDSSAVITKEDDTKRPTVRVEAEADGAEGHLLTYFVRHGEDVFSFMLYPYSEDDSLKGNVEDFIRVVESAEYLDNAEAEVEVEDDAFLPQAEE
jgi:hypothetical protein